MQMALYCPNYGFYEREKDTIGRRGDFYTSVSVGELFGELLARKFAQWLGESEEDQVITKSTERQRKSRRASSSKPPKSARWQIVEAGAHDGRLARDILLWLKEYQPEIFERVEYWIIEPSKRAKVRHGITLGGFERKIRWLAGIEELEAVRGIIFSNELLDAMPVHRVSWDAKSRQWFEWGVGWEQGKFEWVRLENANEAGATRRSRSSKLPASIPRQLQLGSTWLGHL